METLAGASAKMHADASDESNKAEDKYDTRSLETAYLASSQARQATATEEALAAYQVLKPTKQTTIGLSALIELESRGERMWYFVGPAGGGIEVGEVLVITPESPIGQELVGKKAGDKFKFRHQEYRIVSVR